MIIKKILVGIVFVFLNAERLIASVALEVCDEAPCAKRAKYSDDAVLACTKKDRLEKTVRTSASKKPRKSIHQAKENAQAVTIERVFQRTVACVQNAVREKGRMEGCLAEDLIKEAQGERFLVGGFSFDGVYGKTIAPAVGRIADNFVALLFKDARFKTMFEAVFEHVGRGNLDEDRSVVERMDCESTFLEDVGRLEERGKKRRLAVLSLAGAISAALADSVRGLEGSESVKCAVDLMRQEETLLIFLNNPPKKKTPEEFLQFMLNQPLFSEREIELLKLECARCQSIEDHTRMVVFSCQEDALELNNMLVLDNEERKKFNKLVDAFLRFPCMKNQSCMDESVGVVYQHNGVFLRFPCMKEPVDVIYQHNEALVRQSENNCLFLAKSFQALQKSGFDALSERASYEAIPQSVKDVLRRDAGDRYLLAQKIVDFLMREVQRHQSEIEMRSIVQICMESALRLSPGRLEELMRSDIESRKKLARNLKEKPFDVQQNMLRYHYALYQKNWEERLQYVVLKLLDVGVQSLLTEDAYCAKTAALKRDAINKDEQRLKELRTIETASAIELYCMSDGGVEQGIAQSQLYALQGKKQQACVVRTLAQEKCPEKVLALDEEIAALNKEIREAEVRLDALLACKPTDLDVLNKRQQWERQHQESEDALTSFLKNFGCWDMLTQVGRKLHAQKRKVRLATIYLQNKAARFDGIKLKLLHGVRVPSWSFNDDNLQGLGGVAVPYGYKQVDAALRCKPVDKAFFDAMKDIPSVRKDLDAIKALLDADCDPGGLIKAVDASITEESLMKTFEALEARENAIDEIVASLRERVTYLLNACALGESCEASSAAQVMQSDSALREVWDNRCEHLTPGSEELFTFVVMRLFSDGLSLKKFNEEDV